MFRTVRRRRLVLSPYDSFRMIVAICDCSVACAINRDRSYGVERLSLFRPDGSAKLVLRRPNSSAFRFICSTNPCVPHGEIRANTRAAALSDATSARCRRSPSRMRSPRRR